jgi:hypothetical protein
MKGQIGYDLLVIVVFILFVFLIFFEIYILENNRIRILEGRLSAKRVANLVARGVNEVMQVNGTTLQVTLPETLDTGDSYFLSIKSVGRRVDVFWPVSSNNASLSIPLLTSNITEVDITKTVGSGVTVVNISNMNGAINVSI